MTKTELFDIKIEELDSYVYGKCKLKWDLLAKPIDGFGDLKMQSVRLQRFREQRILIFPSGPL